MLIIPPGHAAAPRVSKREKWMIGGVLATVGALALALVISLASAGPSSRHGCIYATVAGAVGAEQIHQCGAEARATCQSVHAPGAYTASAAQAVAAQCRKAGLAVGSQ